MEWIQLWAGITFAAQNGDVEGLLTAAAAGGLHLFDIVPRPGGFSARCAAWHYRKLAALAGAAAHPKTAGSFLLHPSPSPAAGALGRMPCLSPSAALAAGLCLVRRTGGPDARPASTGRRRPVGGRAFPGKCRHTGKAHRRRIRPAPGPVSTL